MGQLIYSALTSLDGYVADEEGNFDWAVPDAEVHRFVNDAERPLGTCLYGRRLYDVMRFWETQPTSGDGDPEMQDYARIWQACDKIVYSRTLERVSSARTRIERRFDVDAVRELKSTSAFDLGIGGPELAGQALLAGLVDECRVLVSPVIVGGGQRWLPDGLRADLELVDERRFGNGVVHLRYRMRT
jgi:dihydrofolate reductase